MSERVFMRKRVRRRSPVERKSLSAVLRELTASSTGNIKVGHLLDAFGDRAFGALMLIFAAPNVIPLPPGTSAILGAPLLFVTAQLMVGRQVLWLPRIIADRSLSGSDFARVTERLIPWIARSERFLKPRLTFLLGPVQDRLIGAVCLLLALILFLPIPFGNMLPGLAISAFAFGLIERDGLAVLLGVLVAIGSVALLAAVSTAIIAGFTTFLSHLGLPL